ncbi:MAG: hypothetical protein ACOCP4_05090 [Candidatus Woesearchaeota archaeon]
MGVENCFEIPKDKRNLLIEENIVGRLSKGTSTDVRVKVGEMAKETARNYEGIDSEALNILAYATEKGRFEEFAKKLKNHYNRKLYFVHPEARKNNNVYAAREAERFFLDCYEALGIKSEGGRSTDDGNRCQEE